MNVPPARGAPHVLPADLTDRQTVDTKVLYYRRYVATVIKTVLGAITRRTVIIMIITTTIIIILSRNRV